MEIDPCAAAALTIITSSTTTTESSSSGSNDSGTRTKPAAVQSLLDLLLSHPRSPLGIRLLRSFVLKPLVDRDAISDRHESVAVFVGDTELRCALRDSNQCLKGFPDMEQMVDKIVKQRATLSDLLTVYRCLLRVQKIVTTLRGSKSMTHHEIISTMEIKLGEAAKFMELVETVVDADQLKSSRSNRELWGTKWIQLKPMKSELSVLHTEILKLRTAITDEHARLVKLIGLPARKKDGAESTSVHFERSENDKVGLHFRVTKKQWKMVSKALQDAGEKFVVKATLKAGTLFATSKLSTLLLRYQQLSLEYAEMQSMVVDEVLLVAGTYTTVLGVLAEQVGIVDCMTALAHVAAVNDWCRPEFLPDDDDDDDDDANEGDAGAGGGAGVSSAGTKGVSSAETKGVSSAGTKGVSSAGTRAGESGLVITGMRHPIVEAHIGAHYVPTDIDMLTSNYHGRVAIITGLNMGGKSTLIRAVGICAVLAQMGSFVPATSAKMAIFDRIVTRVGASDSTRKGVSTFMAEMLEVSSALQKATKRSLIIIDELGRGTSTHEGFGIAWAVVQRLAETVQATVLFATHFHELTTMEGCIPGVVNYHVKADVRLANLVPSDGAVEEGGKQGRNTQITMLYKLYRGASDRSYGVAVARLCNFPTRIIDEAEQTMAYFESHARGHERENGQDDDQSRKKSKLA